MRERRDRGFTLIELMVVLVIMGSLVALVGPNLFRILGDSRRDTAVIQLHQLGTAVDAYRMRQRRLPENLEALTQVSAESPEPYLRSLPKDPWDGAYAYRVDGKRFAVMSAGEDGQLGTEDDLVWPDPA